MNLFQLIGSIMVTAGLFLVLFFAFATLVGAFFDWRMDQQFGDDEYAPYDWSDES